MVDGSTIVVDIGKTNAKVSLWDPSNRLVERNVRSNKPQRSASGYQALDVDGIDAWLVDSLAAFARLGPVARIVTVGHGAAAALVRDNTLFLDPVDYENEVPVSERAAYDAQRDSFSATGSPALPQGLNLGVQLHLLEKTLGPLPNDVIIVPWPQYWAWRFSGVAASEVTSLGCHTDLWRPAEKTFSELAVRRGWAARMAPLRSAGASLGTITPEFAATTGLNKDCQVLCGLHDSNAALQAARGHREIAANEATVLSTGTWFVAMRSLGKDAQFDMEQLEEARDCLVNDDLMARPTPSARFMGGRELELIAGIDSFALTDGVQPQEFLRRLPGLVEKYTCPCPSFVSGVGPFPAATGAWPDRPDDLVDQRVLIHLYLALMANSALDLIGSRDRLLVEGRFAEDPVFVRTLATLRPGQRVYTSNAEHDVAYGALRLVTPDLAPSSELMSIAPLDVELVDYAADWRTRAIEAQEAA